VVGCQTIAPPDNGDIIAGQRVADRNCGMCHSTSAAPSRLADAPPFSQLHLRYGAGGLDALLSEGMLTPERLMEEGRAPNHPRMPMVTLGIDERVQLVAYLRSLEPPR
jgi:mono/diheme cytochrome c family protein